MTLLRFFTDEDVYGAIVVELRCNGYDAVSTPEAGRNRESDESQLNWAIQENRVLVTFNVAHFANLYSQFLANKKHHSGIIVSSQLHLGEVLRRLLSLAQQRDTDSMTDRLEFLSDWQGG